MFVRDHGPVPLAGSMDGQICAVKTISDNTKGQDKAFRMFLKEAAVLRDCSHSRVIEFKALVRINSVRNSGRSCREGGKWALVLEYAKVRALLQAASHNHATPTML
eukprot:GHUV01034962.1.p3 GENE.GHUV01034962.1~~GHUV01034962.1.p3  ORF type:complete len:106 (+),score=20.18 GHUV01034962.1:413-730(+)